MAKNPTPDEAISQCFAALAQGVLPCTVKPATMEAIRKRFYPTFKKLLEGKPARKWAKDGPRVIRTSYYIGTIAAFCAFAEGKDEATPEHFKEALSFVEPRCQIGRVKTPRGAASVRWVYCS